MTRDYSRHAPQTPPVLLLAFNRPAQTARILERIKEAQPLTLYVACDGLRPDRDDDIQNVKAIHEMVARIDWCENIKTLYREKNLGCRNAVSEAITWFLNDAAEGIILEDDCLPDPTFFPYCAEMLARYRNTTNVTQIAGYNLLSGQYNPGSDYFFSQLGWQWGWATWKRAWDHFDLRMANWPEFKKGGFHEYYPFVPERVFIFEREYTQPSTWDYQWQYASAQCQGLSAVPTFSLIENIGFGPAATHGTNPDLRQRYLVPIRSLNFPLRHSLFVYPEQRYDRMLLRKCYNLPLDRNPYIFPELWSYRLIFATYYDRIRLRVFYYVALKTKLRSIVGKLARLFTS